MFEWLEYEFMLRALAATSVLSFSIAPVGAFLVLRRLSLAGEAMAHAIVPGIVIGFVISGLSVTSMIIGGLAAGITVALLTSLLARFTIIRDHGWIGASPANGHRGDGPGFPALSRGHRSGSAEKIPAIGGAAPKDWQHPQPGH